MRHATDNMDMSIEDMDEKIADARGKKMPEEQKQYTDESDYMTVGIIHGQRGPFTYKCPRALYDSIEEGHYLVVENRFGFAVGEVIEKHPDRQDNEGYNYRWAFQKVDEAEAERLQALSNPPVD